MPENRIGLRLTFTLMACSGWEADEEDDSNFWTNRRKNWMITDLRPYRIFQNLYWCKSIPLYWSTEIAKALSPDVQRHISQINAGFDQEKGNKIYSEGLADAVVFGKKPFISNPDLPKRFETRSELAALRIRNTFYTPGEKGLQDLPSFYQEFKSIIFQKR